MKILLVCFLILGCSSLNKLERMTRQIIVIAKSNNDDERNVIVKDCKGKLLKIEEPAFVYSYNPGDTIK
jgi:hypothetical protein